MAEDVIRYADKHNIDRFTLLGHSMGGKTAMALAGLYPNRLDGVIIIDAPPRNGMKDQGYISKTVDLVIRLKQFMDISHMSRSQVMSTLSRTFKNVFRTHAIWG